MMHSVLRSTLLLSLVICGCGGTDARAQDRSVSPVTPRSPPCSGDSARTFELPRFALADRAFADWIGDDIVVLNVGPIAHQERVPAGQPAELRGAIYTTADGRWTEIPPPASALPRGPSVVYYARVVGEHVALLWYSTWPRDMPSGGLVFDRSRGAWSEIPPAAAPPSSAFLTGPYREATAGDRWVFWPTTPGAAPDPAPYVLDVRAPRWTRGTSDGAPQTPALFHRVVVRGDRVLVPDRDRDVAGIFDPVANQWEQMPFVHLGTDYVVTVSAPDGRSVAALAWSPAGAGRTRLRAWVADVDARSMAALPSPRGTFGARPNTRHVHYDGGSIVYVGATRAHRFSGGRWTSAALPFDGPVTSGGFVRGACGEQVLLQHDRYWLFDVARMAWHPVSWPADAPTNGHRVLFAPDRIALLGAIHEEVEPAPRCPPGAPCVPPARRRVEDPRAFLIPLR